jgi:uncharacterized membrane protein YgdD (TMEM256/DUF423 family)
MNRRTAFLVAGITGFLGVALGAFGAHGLKLLLSLHHGAEIWSTAVLYHLIHVPVLLWLAGRKIVSALPIIFFTLGILFFSGSLYALALSEIRWLGAITPIGGLLLVAGWLWIAFLAYRTESIEQ